MTEPLLVARNLSIHFNGHPVVDNLSLTIGREKVALVGESGSGKSMTARALMGLVRKPGIVSADTLCYRQTDLLTLKPRQWNEVRGAKIAMVLQDPRYALNPVRCIGKQIEESLTLHHSLTRADRHERGAECSGGRRLAGEYLPQLSRPAFRRHGPARHAGDSAG